jgi:hypothetical protein
VNPDHLYNLLFALKVQEFYILQNWDIFYNPLVVLMEQVGIQVNWDTFYNLLVMAVLMEQEQVDIL